MERGWRNLRASAVSLPQLDETLTVTGHFEPTSGATLDGATVLVTAGTNTQTVPLISGTFTATYNYDAANPGPYYISVTFPDAVVPCTLGGSTDSAYIVSWTPRTPVPYCQDSHSVINLSESMPYVDSQITLTLIAKDAGGWTIPNLPYTYYSISRVGTADAVENTGFTDSNGQAVLPYGNGNYGAHEDVIQCTFGTSGGCFVQATVNWQPI